VSPPRRFEPSGPLTGERSPPPDKSISHRAALIAAMAEGTTRIEGYLNAADTRATLAAVRMLGAEGSESRTGGGGLALDVRGIGLPGPGALAGNGEIEIDVGNSGTLLRLLPGWLAGQGGGAWTLDGDDSIRRRPVDRVAEPLSMMGASVSCRDGRLPPLRVEGSELAGIEYRLPVASAQVKSCVLLAGLLADGATTVVEPAPTRDHTERMLAAAGADLRVDETTVAVRVPPGRRIEIRPADRLAAGEIEVPGDFSSAAFLIVAALVVPGSDVRIENVGLNPTRIGLLGVLHRMGAAVEVEEDGASGGELRGSVHARHGPLSATRVGAPEVPLAIDELPLVGLLGCFAEGRTVLEGAEELRHKESDRIAGVVDGLRGLGAEIESRPDGFAVEGGGGVLGGALDARGDHRLAMLGAIAGIASRDGVEVEGMESAAVSYPGFESDLEAFTRR
jgi:3-phosphoshikimate 1-carboxyvinyltransferase